MSAEVMLLLIAEPESAERLSDLLAEAGLAAGWYESAVDLVGGRAPYRDQRQKVRGRRPRVRFEVIVSRDTAAAIAVEIERRFVAAAGLSAPLQKILPLVGE